MSTFFLLQNIRSLSKNVDDRSQLVSKKDPLVVALTETWTTEFTNAKLFRIENYKEVILCYRKKRGDGVGIYFKKILNLRYYVLKTLMLHNCLPFLFVLNTTPQFAFAIVYKPPDTNEDISIETRNLHLDNLPKNSNYTSCCLWGLQY